MPVGSAWPGQCGLPGPAELALGAGLPAGGSGRHPLPAETIYNRILTIFNAGEDSSVQYRFGIYETTRNLMEDYWARALAWAPM